MNRLGMTSEAVIRKRVSALVGAWRAVLSLEVSAEFDG